MNKTGEARLLKLAEHLEKGKLGHKVFDFNQINNAIEPKRGTHGCAMGELPIVFPKVWKWNDYGNPISAFGSVMGAGVNNFFDIDTEEGFALFYADQSLPWSPNKRLGENATRKQVATNIRLFVAWKRKQSK